MADKAPEGSEITAAFEANKDLGDTKVLVKSEKKLLGGLIKIPVQEEKHLLSTAEGEKVLNKYEYSLKDGLTGLLKKDAWGEEAKHFYEYCLREGTPFGLLYIDINDFKPYNDISHEFGDEVIKIVARAIRESTRESDIDGRVGGDEFAVALAGVNPEVIEEIKHRIDDKLSELTSSSELMKQHGVTPTVSIGHYVSKESDTTFEGILDAADKDMQEVKRLGKHGR